MSICKDCIHYEICDPYVSPNESFPEVEGGCTAFRDKGDWVEVRHGEWQTSDKPYAYYEWKCSVCGFDEYRHTVRNGKYKIMNFCPNCGAKMENARNDNG